MFKLHWHQDHVVKLAFKFFGPFQVIQRVGVVAYKLKLPAGCSLNPVFHVSLLKKMVGKHVQVTPVVPNELVALQYLEKVLQKRVVSRGHRSIVLVLVKWSHMPESLATLKDFEAIKQQFPSAAWGQAAPQKVGDVTVQPLVDPEDSRMGRRRSSRPRKPNKNVIGNEWM